MIHFNAVGQKDVRKPDPVQKDSIFRIYSMTKPVTGVAMMMLYEEGKWRLEDPVARHIPEFARLKVYTGQERRRHAEARGREAVDDDARADDAYGGARLRPERGEPGRQDDHRGERAERRARRCKTMIDGLAKLPLIAQPGTRWSLQHRRRRAGLSGREDVRACRSTTSCARASSSRSA